MKTPIPLFCCTFKSENTPYLNSIKLVSSED